MNHKKQIHMNEVEVVFTKMCKDYENMGESLKGVSLLLSSQSNQESVKQFLRVVFQGLMNKECVEDLSHMVANALVDNFIMIMKTEHGPNCGCGEYRGSVNNENN